MYVMYGGCLGPDVALILLRPKHSSRFIFNLYYVCTCVRTYLCSLVGVLYFIIINLYLFYIYYIVLYIKLYCETVRE